MKLMFALLIYVNSDLQPDRTTYWEKLETCMWYANKLNQNTITNNRIITAQCLPEWRKP